MSRATPPRQQGEIVIVLCLVFAVVGILGWFFGYSQADGGWREDCTKLKAHVSGLNSKVYKCEPTGQ